MCFRLQLEQNKQVANKLYKATFAMFTLPLLCFFLCQMVIFKNDESYIMWSGFAAVGMVNLVIFAYVWSAFHEDESDFEDDNRRKFNDEDGPRVGAFKQRTD
jgi:hypothetical protein